MFAKCTGIPKCGPSIRGPTFIQPRSFHTNTRLHEEIKQQYKPPRPVIRVKPQDPNKLRRIRLDKSVELVTLHLRKVQEEDKQKYEEQQRIKQEELAKAREIRKAERKKAKEALKIQTAKKVAIEQEQRALEKAQRRQKILMEAKIKSEMKKEFLDVLMEDANLWEYHPKELVYKRYEFTGELPPKMQSWMTNNVRPSFEKFKTDN